MQTTTPLAPDTGPARSTPPRSGVMAAARFHGVESLLNALFARHFVSPDNGMVVIVDRPWRGQVDVHVSREGRISVLRHFRLALEAHPADGSLLLTPCPVRRANPLPHHRGKMLPGERSRVALFRFDGWPLTSHRLLDFGTHFIPYRACLDLSALAAIYVRPRPVGLPEP